MDSNLQNKTDLLLGNRDVLFELLEDAVSDMREMAPSYIHPIESIVSHLHLTDDDVSLLSSFDTQKSYVTYIEDVKNMIRMRTEELSRVKMQYAISLRSYLSSAIVTPELYNLDESYLDRMKKVYDGAPVTRSRTTTAVSKLSLNEMSDQKRMKVFSDVGRDLLKWKFVSGNRSPLDGQDSSSSSSCNNNKRGANDVTALLRPHIPKVGGKVLSISFKPVKWQKITQNRNVRAKADNIRRIAKSHRHIVDINEHSPSASERNVEGEIKFLKKLLLFSLLSDEEIGAIGSEMQLEVFSTGTVVIDKFGKVANEEVTKLYVILDGIVGQQNAQDEVVRSLQRGEVLGESLLAPPSDAAAAITATSSSTNSYYSFVALNTVTMITVPLAAMNRALSNNGTYCLLGGRTPPVDAYELSTEMTSLINHVEHFVDFLITLIHSTGNRLKSGNELNVGIESNVTAPALDEAVQAVNFVAKVEAKRNILLDFFSLCAPEYLFQDTIRDIICMTRDFFEVDRAGFFFLDKLKNTMVLYGTQIDGPGVELPIKGIAGYIAQNATVINLKDCYDDDIFDASMDKRTGYRTKQMLCAPAHDTRNNVGGVIQLINTLDDRVFSETDENFSILFAELIGDRIQFMKSSVGSSSASSTNVSPAYAIKDAFKIKVVDFVSFKSHNHIKCTTKIFSGATQLGVTHVTELFDSRPCNDSSNRITTIDAWVEFPELSYNQLPQTSVAVFQFFSKNNHPVGWVGLSLFDYKRSLRAGIVKLRMFEGSYPSPCLFHCMENYSDSSAQTVTLSLKPFDSAVVYEPEFNKAVSAFFAAAANTSAWYLQRMSSSEKSRLSEITAASPHVLSLSTADKDLLWRMRTAFKHDSRLLSWYLLAVDWAQPDAAAIGYQLLKIWAPPNNVLENSLLHLSHLFPDPRVRAFGVSQLKSLDDSAFAGLLVVLVQCLRYDLHDDSALGRLLLRRSLSNPVIGLRAYQLMRGEAAVSSQIRRRYDIISEIYIRACDLGLRSVMEREFLVLRLIEYTGRTMLALDGSQGILFGATNPAAAYDKRRKLLELIAEYPFPESFTLTFFSDVIFGKFLFDEFRIVEKESVSKKACNFSFEVAGDANLGRVIENSSLVVRTDDNPPVSAAAAVTANPNPTLPARLSSLRITYCIGTNGKREQCMLQFLRVVDIILVAEGFRSAYCPSSEVQLLSEDSYIVMKRQNFRSLNSIANNSLDNLQLFLGLDSSSENSNSAAPPPNKVVKFTFANKKYFNNILWNYLYTTSPVVGGPTIGVRSRRSKAANNSNRSSGSRDSSSFSSVKERFVDSFLFHSVVSYVLGGIDNRDGDNCFFAPTGDIMFTDVPFSIKRNASPPGRSKSIPIYLPLYSQLLSMGDPSVYVDLVNLLSEMFMALRRCGRQLEGVMAVAIRNAGLNDAEVAEALACLHGNLQPHLSDNDAEKAFRSSVILK